MILRFSHIEKPNRTLQKQCLDRIESGNRDSPFINKCLAEYLIWYNTQRTHQSLNCQKPIDFYLNSLPHFFAKKSNVLRDSAAEYIDRVLDGNTSNCKPAGEGISELRIDFQKGYRVFYTMSKGAIVILLAGSDKSGNQKKQTKDIALAKKLKNYLKAKGEL
jgi:putative addiction module killer protein